MTTVFPTTCDFTLIKRNDIGKAYAYVFLYSMSQPVTTQIVNPGSSIKFNNHGRLASIAWLNSDELTMLKDGLFEIEFSINYQLNNKNVQVELYINGTGVGVAFGSDNGNSFNYGNSGIGKINGKYNLRLYKNDKLKLVGKSNQFIIKPAGFGSEIISYITVNEI